jgi:RNA polymerase sigma-70 factor (ECF subfamily)
VTDEKIVRAVLGGDTEAYTALVDRYRKVVYGLAYHHLRHFEDARDVAQEAFIQAYLHLGQLREPERFGAWLRQLTVNECRMWQRRRRPVEPLDELTPAAGGGEDALHTRLAVEQALACLSEANRLTLILFYFRSHSLQEIAEFLEVPVTTIKSRLRNARARLRKEWMRMTEETLSAQTPAADFTHQIMAFFAAVRANDVERVRQFVIAHPALVHRRYARQDGTWVATEADDAHADTALHFAAFHGHVALARVLLEHGADVNAENHDGSAPLVLAAWEGGIEVLQAILEHGPDLSRSGAPALYTAAEHGARDRCELLLAHGAEPDLHTAIILGMADRVRGLLDADAALRDLPDRRGRTPLDIAVEYNQPPIAERLIARGAAVNAVQAAGLGMLETVRAQIERDPSLLNPTDGSETPLMAAARNGHVPVLEYLLAQGADVHLGQVEYIHRILPIHVSSAAAVGTLVAAGADVNVPYRGFTPLQRALSRGDDALVEALRHHGGLQRLHLACNWGRPEQIEQLIRLGADVDEVDEQGRTPLAIALASAQDPQVHDPGERARYAAIAEVLRRHGAKG